MPTKMTDEVRRAGRKASQKRYHAANKEKIAARVAAYFAARPGHRQAKHIRYKKKHRERIRDRHFARYGITARDYDRLAAAQDYACMICNAEAWMERTGSLCVDHDHDTGAVRGLLCDRCNRALGLLHDSVEVLEDAIHYLKRTKP